MGGKNGSNGTRRKSELQKKFEELETENLRLTESNHALGVKIVTLNQVNSTQCQRLGQEELLRMRIKELENKLQKDEAQ